MPSRTGLQLLCGALLLAACASKGGEMRVVVPRKTTYLDAEALDGGVVEVPPRVLEEVRPTAPAGIHDDGRPPSVVAQFTIDTEGRIGDIEITRAGDDRLTDLAIAAISRWKVDPARRSGQAIPTVATLLLAFDGTP